MSAGTPAVRIPETLSIFYQPAIVKTFRAEKRVSPFRRAFMDISRTYFAAAEGAGPGTS